MLKVKSSQHRKGMTLVELLVSITVFTLVVAGSISSAMLFANISSNHANTAAFRHDVRIGFEQMAFDVRNANKVVSRTSSAFTLSFPNSSNVRYWHVPDDAIVYRQVVGSNQEVVMRNVTEFDVLTGSGDVGSNKILSFEDNELSLEALTLKTSNGRSRNSEMKMTNLTLKLRSS